MEAWIGVIGALAGGGIAFLGQYGLRLTERRATHTALLLEQCAQVIALSEDYRNRVWEERRLGVQGPVSEWNLGDYRLAEARVKILCREVRVLDSLERLQRTGVDLGRAWRLAQVDGEEVETAWGKHKEALNDFIRISDPSWMSEASSVDFSPGGNDAWKDDLGTKLNAWKHAWITASERH